MGAALVSKDGLEPRGCAEGFGGARRVWWGSKGLVGPKASVGIDLDLDLRQPGGT